MADAAPTDRPIVQLAKVEKRYGETLILDRLDLDIPAGQKLAIIGPSGSGKSTVLRLVKGLETFQAGTITVAGESVRPPRGDSWFARRPPRQHVVGMVFQHFNLFPHMTALGNITEAPRRVLGLGRAEAEARARDLLSKVGLGGKEQSYPRQLSGGQQQRVAIARALAMQPRVMLFDEVTSALDPELVGEVLGVIRALSHESGMTMLLVTHEMGFARDVADRVLFMEKGRVVEDAAPEVIFTNPASERTRGFLRAVLDR